MDHCSIDAVLDRVKTYGRTFYDAQDKVLYCNYTCGTFEVDFTGTVLFARFAAIPDTMVPPQRGPVFPGQEPPKREDWPFISVFLDDDDTPSRTVRVHDGEEVMLYFSEEPETHRIRIVKLTENFRTALGVTGFKMAGTLNAFEPAAKDVIEFIGDSITCGFGNATNDVGHEFAASEEDGWMTHGAIAARTLGLSPRFICVSGISVKNAPGMPGLYCMSDLYPYTDRIIQDKLAEKRGEPTPEYQPFDFAAHPAKYVVLNLGTNDANQIFWREDKEQAGLDFEKNYYEFVSTIRKLNGPDTTIICALGCMDYFLFDKIREIVAKWKADSGDENIYTMKYNKMMNVGPDAGACLHPAIHRHKLMAKDLVAFIEKISK